jgi:uncharacterized protein (DUF58 family)
VVPTIRLVVLAFAATILAIVAAFVPFARAPLALFDGLVLVAFGLDVALASGRRLTVERSVARILSVGRGNPVTLTIRNRSGRTLRAVVHDDPVQNASIVGLPALLEIPAHGRASVRYELTPTRRGPRELGAVTVRYGSVLGLAQRQERTALKAAIEVYPDVHAARSLELLRRQGRADARIGSLRVRGGDTEFERLRPYQQGDEVRHIDWRATARKDDATVRQYQAESNQNVVFAVDIGRSMRGESGIGAKLTSVDHALNAALLVADVALRGGDRAGLLAFDDMPRVFLRPEGGRTGARKLTRASYALEANLSASDYRTAMSFLKTQVRGRSLIVLFTQVLEPRAASELATAMKMLLPRHLPLCVLLRDTDVEALAVAPAHDDEELYVRAAAAEILDFKSALIRKLERAGVLVLDAEPRDVTPELVKRYWEIKARRLL